MIDGILIGLVFGILLQRTQFCFVSGFQNTFFQKNLQFLTSLFIAITIQSIGFFTLSSYSLIEIPNTNLPIIATVIGGFIFGFGMIMSGCCACGGWFRAGEGGIIPFIVIVVFSITTATCSSGALKWHLLYLLKDEIAIGNLQNLFNISPWYLVAILMFITSTLIYISSKQIYYKNLNFKNLNFKSRLHPFLGAFFIGIFGILAWYLSAKTGREFGYSVSIPSCNLIQYLITGQKRYINWGSMFVIGIFIGSFLSSILNKEFTLSSPPASQFPRRILGAILMGIGASLAKGCAITNSLVATAYFSIQAWLATFMIIAGCYVGIKILKPTQCKI